MDEALHAPPAHARIATAAILAFAVAGCRATAAPPQAVTSAGSLVVAAAAAEHGLCRAAAALPDVGSARRDFQNIAHAALHELAAAPGLARSPAARVLETMQVVERDIATGAGAAVLAPDLDALRSSTEAAIRALGLPASTCAP
jgi:hypothetical protein